MIIPVETPIFMPLIHQTIPERYIPSLLDNGHHFTPCYRFKDHAEFRYGYCLEHYFMPNDDAIEKCVEATYKNDKLNQ